MKLLILFLTCFLMINCSDKKNCCTIIDLGIELEYLNENGEDLLNPDTKNHYKEKNMKVFYLVGGEKKEIIRGNLDNPRMLSLSPPHNERNYYLLGLSLNDLSSEDINTTYLQLNEYDTDTITHTLHKGNNNNKIIDKVWYNGKISVDRYTFKIMK